jgi:hypothetical protein
MSPEQCSSGRVTGASDQYSLGALVYQMIAGVPPFTGNTMSVMQAHLHQEPTPLADVRPECPGELASAVHRMLAKAPEDRFPTISAAIAAAGATLPGLDDPVRQQLEDLATPVSGVLVEQVEYVLREGQRRAFPVTLTTPTGKRVMGRRISLQSADVSVADVDAGDLMALSPGSTEVVVAAGSARMKVQVSIEPDPIGDIRITPSEATVLIGGTTQLRAVVLDIDGTQLDERAVLWRSSNPAVARVSSSGVVEGVEQGQALVAARTGGKYSTATITIGGAARREVPSGGRSYATPAGVKRTVEVLPAAATGATSGETRGGSSGAATPSDTEPSRRNPVLLAAGAGVVLLLIALVLWRPWGGGAAPPAVTTPAAATASLSVATNVPAGGVVVARSAAGTVVPLSAQATLLEPGNYTLEFRAPGYAPADSIVVVREGESFAWNPQFTQLAAAPSTPSAPPVTTTNVADGSIAAIGNLPPGGLIVARDASGRALPLSERPTPLPPGNYSLEFRAPGYHPADSMLTLASRQHVVWAPAIREVAPAAAAGPREGIVEVRGTFPTGAVVSARDADGRVTQINGGRISLPPGTYTLELRASGIENESRAITVRAGETEVWTPALRAVRATPPTVDVRADQAAIDALVRDFHARFARRDTSVVALLPAAERQTWQLAFTNQAAFTDFRATLASADAARVTGDSATVQFTMNVSFRSGGRAQSPVLRYQASARRTASGWRLVQVSPQR